ncbi:MAG: hypothetical protein WCL54_02655 [Clostridia bacterium]
MKHILRCLIIFILLLIFSISTYANSGPVYWKGYPLTDVMLIQKDSPIKVLNEDLTFDFSNKLYDGWSLSSLVTASYKMVNPTNQAQTVQMAFPYIGTVDSLTSNDVMITAEHKKIPYEVYFGDPVDDSGTFTKEENNINYDFNNILGSIKTKQYQAGNFDANEKGKLYTIDVTPLSDSSFEFVVDFNIDSEKTKIIADDNFNGYERDENKIILSSHCNEPETLKIFVIGEDIKYNVNGYTIGESKEKTDSYSYHITTKEVEMKQFILNSVYAQSRRLEKNSFDKSQIYNLYAKYLDNELTNNFGFSSIESILYSEENERFIVLLYTVKFTKNSSRNVSVNYVTSGTMDKTKTIKPLHKFRYILNPAKNWNDFKNLNIKIIAPKRAPYIVESSVAFHKNDNVYTAKLKKLPEEDLSFTLYEDEKIALLDQLNYTVYSMPYLLGIIPLILIIIIAYIINKRKKKKVKQDLAKAKKFT